MFCRFLLSILLSICLESLVFSQSTEISKDFMSTFEKETSELEQESNPQPLLLSIGAEILPNWFWNIPSSNSQELYAIGISDPQMESQQKAKLQAIERAKMQIALISGTEVSGITDYYVEASGEKNKIEENYYYLGKRYIVGSFSIIDSFKTRFGERMLLLKLNKREMDSIPIKIDINRYKSMTKAENGWYTSEKTIFTFLCDTNNFKYEYTQDDRNFSIESLLNRDTINIPLGMYQYSINSMNASDSTFKINTINLEHRGLWYGYIQSLINSITLFASNKRSSSKSINHLYNNENKSLIRDVSKNNVHFFINKICSQNGNLDINIKNMF